MTPQEWREVAAGIDALSERLSRLEKELPELRRLARERKARQASVVVDEGRRQGWHPDYHHGRISPRTGGKAP